MTESYLNECLERFHELPDEIQEVLGGFEAAIKIKNLEEKYGVDLSFAVILVAIGELNIDDLSDYLNLKFEVDKTKGEEITKELEDQIFSNTLDLIINNPELQNIVSDEEVSANNQFGPITNLSTEDKKELIVKTFSDNVVPALQAEPAKLHDFNIAIFQIFNVDENLGEKIENLLYINQEKLSDHHIIIDGHPASPTIANWLKDFIKKYGSGIFDEVALAEYLTQSPNIKQLKPVEKELVRKVLKLYRNLSFFPESMDGMSLDQWEIFPVDRSKLVNIAKTPINQKPAVNEMILEAVDEVATEKQKVIFDLQKTLAKYSPSTLEYKAISQEINRLSKK
ncbi:MAG: hypothetical protein WAW11_00465 [Patescibacteria group bacterium]